MLGGDQARGSAEDPLAADVTGEGTALRVAAVFDAVDEDGRPYFSADRRRVVDADERTRLSRYLTGAPLALRAYGLEADPLDPARGPVVPLGYHTDGVWVWQEAAAYYLDGYGVAPDDELLAHIESADYRPPTELPDALLNAAADAALQPSAVQATGGRRAAQYFASELPGHPAHAPAGLLRQWHNTEGYRVDELLNRAMRWMSTGAFAGNDRSGEDDFVPIPPRSAAQIVDRWWADEHGA